MCIPPDLQVLIEQLIAADELEEALIHLILHRPEDPECQQIRDLWIQLRGQLARNEGLWRSGFVTHDKRDVIRNRIADAILYNLRYHPGTSSDIKKIVQETSDKIEEDWEAAMAGLLVRIDTENDEAPWKNWTIAPEILKEWFRDLGKWDPMIIVADGLTVGEWVQMAIIRDQDQPLEWKDGIEQAFLFQGERSSSRSSLEMLLFNPSTGIDNNAAILVVTANDPELVDFWPRTHEGYRSLKTRWPKAGIKLMLVLTTEAHESLEAMGCVLPHVEVDLEKVLVHATYKDKYETLYRLRDVDVQEILAQRSFGLWGPLGDDRAFIRELDKIMWQGQEHFQRVLTRRRRQRIRLRRSYLLRAIFRGGKYIREHPVRVTGAVSAVVGIAVALFQFWMARGTEPDSPTTPSIYVDSISGKPAVGAVVPVASRFPIKLRVQDPPTGRYEISILSRQNGEAWNMISSGTVWNGEVERELIVQMSPTPDTVELISVVSGRPLNLSVFNNLADLDSMADAHSRIYRLVVAGVRVEYVDTVERYSLAGHLFSPTMNVSGSAWHLEGRKVQVSLSPINGASSGASTASGIVRNGSWTVHGLSRKPCIYDQQAFRIACVAESHSGRTDDTVYISLARPEIRITRVEGYDSCRVKPWTTAHVFGNASKVVPGDRVSVYAKGYDVNGRITGIFSCPSTIAFNDNEYLFDCSVPVEAGVEFRFYAIPHCGGRLPANPDGTGPAIICNN